MRNQHMCMFLRADNEHGFIQCTIKPQYRKDFEALGFVDHVDDLPQDKPKRKRRTKEEMAQDSE